MMRTVCSWAGIFCFLYFLFLLVSETFQIYRICWIIFGFGLFLPSLTAGLKIPGFFKVLYVLFYAAVIAGVIVIEAGNIYVSRQGRAMDTDVIVLLGCKVPSRAMNNRSQAALDYLSDHPGVEIICTGGQGSDEAITEAEGYKRILVNRGIAPEQIFLEDRSTTTVENLIFSDERYAIKEKKTGIVTSGYHVLRSVLIARKLGFRQVCGIGGKTMIEYELDNLVREEFAFIKALLNHSI